MTGRPKPRRGLARLPAQRRSPYRWLILVHQLPSNPSNLRVRTWRRLQQLGAIAVKQAVYVLPDSPTAREDFEWLKAEIEEAGGEATVFAADSVDAWSDDALVEEFRRARQQAYAELALDVEQVLRRLNARQPRGKGRAPAARRRLDELRHRFAAADSLDFFGSAGRDRVVTLLEEFEQRLLTRAARSPAKAPVEEMKSEVYRRRLWVTRPRPGVDRMASAWLIKRFIDPEARFDFVRDRDAAPPDAIPFDMFGVEFSHHGGLCTFETLCERFAIRGAPLIRLAAIVHDLDLKDGRFGAADAATVGMMIEGLQLTYADDAALLAQGITLFEALHRSVEQGTRRIGLQAVAGQRRRVLAGGKSRRRKKR